MNDNDNDNTLKADQPIFIVDEIPHRNELRLGDRGCETGVLSWKDGVLHFEGNADESAKIFIHSLGKQLGWPVNISRANAIGQTTPTDPKP